MNKQGLWILAIACILVIGGTIVLNPEKETTLKEFSINYSDLTAKKIIETGQTRTETIFLPDAEKFGVLMAIPKTLAEDASQIGFSHNGKKEIWKNDPVVYFSSTAETLKIKAEYQKKSGTASISAVLPKEFTESLSEEQKQELVNELEKMIQLNPNDETANEIENQLAKNITESFAKANLKENYQTNTVFFDAETSTFESIKSAFSKTAEWAAEKSSQQGLNIVEGTPILVKIDFKKSEKSIQQDSLEALRKNFPLLENKNPLILTYSEKYPNAGISEFFVKPESKDAVYRNDPSLDNQVSKTMPIAAIRLAPQYKEYDKYISINIEPQKFSEFAFKLNISLDFNSMEKKPDYFEGTIILGYTSSGEFSHTYEIPVKGYFNYCKTSELDEAISEHEVLLRIIDCRNQTISMKRLLFDSTNIEYYTSPLYLTHPHYTVEDTNKELGEKLDSEIISLYTQNLANFETLNSITSNIYSGELALEKKRLEEWQNYYSFRFDPFGENARKTRIKLLQELTELEKEFGIYSSLSEEEKNTININALGEELEKEYNEKYGYNNILITKLIQARGDLQAEHEMLQSGEFKEVLIGDIDAFYGDTVNVSAQINGLTAIIEKLRKGESLIEIYYENSEKLETLEEKIDEITPVNKEKYPSSEEYWKAFTKYSELENEQDPLSKIETAFYYSQAKDELRTQIYLINKDFLENHDQAEIFFTQIQVIENTSNTIWGTIRAFDEEIEGYEDFWGVGIFKYVFKKGRIEALESRITELNEEEKGLQSILKELEKGKSITDIDLTEQSAMNNPVIVAEIEKEKYLQKMKEIPTGLISQEELANANNEQKSEYYRQLTQTRRELKMIQIKGAFENAEKFEELGKELDVKALLHRSLEEYIQIEVVCCPDCSNLKKQNKSSSCFDAQTGKDYGIEAYEKSESIGSRWFSTLYWSNVRTMTHGLTSPKAIITFGMIAGTIKVISVIKNASSMATMSSFLARTSSKTAAPSLALAQTKTAKAISTIKKILVFDINPVNHLFTRISGTTFTQAATKKLSEAIFKYRYGGLQGLSSFSNAQATGIVRILPTDELLATGNAGTTTKIIGKQTFRISEGPTTLMYENGRTAIVFSKQSPAAIEELAASAKNLPRAMGYLQREGVVAVQQVDDATTLAGIMQDAAQRTGANVVEIKATAFSRVEAIQYLTQINSPLTTAGVSLSNALARPFNNLSAQGLSFETAFAGATARMSIPGGYSFKAAAQASVPVKFSTGPLTGDYSLPAAQCNGCSLETPLPSPKMEIDFVDSGSDNLVTVLGPRNRMSISASELGQNEVAAITIGPDTTEGVSEQFYYMDLRRAKSIVVIQSPADGQNGVKVMDIIDATGGVRIIYGPGAFANTRITILHKDPWNTTPVIQEGETIYTSDGAGRFYYGGDLREALNPFGSHKEFLAHVETAMQNPDTPLHLMAEQMGKQNGVDPLTQMKSFFKKETGTPPEFVTRNCDISGCYRDGRIYYRLFKDEPELLEYGNTYHNSGTVGQTLEDYPSFWQREVLPHETAHAYWDSVLPPESKALWESYLLKLQGGTISEAGELNGVKRLAKLDHPVYEGISFEIQANEFFAVAVEDLQYVALGAPNQLSAFEFKFFSEIGLVPKGMAPVPAIPFEQSFAITISPP